MLPGLILLYTSLIKFFTANPFDAAFTFRNYVYIWNSEETQRAIVNTVIVSGGGALVGVVLGIACSYFTVRLRPTGYRVLDALVMLPFGVPGIVLGLGLLWAYAYLPLPLYGTLTLIVLAYVTRFLPYATETSGARFVQLDRSLEEAAWTAGASRLSGVWRILMPLSLPSLQSSYFLLFMAFFREISATILIFTASTSVLSVSIWSSFEQANWGLAERAVDSRHDPDGRHDVLAALGHARRAQAIEERNSPRWVSPSVTSSNPMVPLPSSTRSRSTSPMANSSRCSGPPAAARPRRLRCIAGLETPTGGSIAINGETVSDPAANLFVPPHERDLGMVFQSYAVWPHLTVAENVAFPLTVKGERDVATERQLGARHRRHGQARQAPSVRIVRRTAAARGAGAGDRRACRDCCCSTSRCRTSTPACATARGSRSAGSSAN